MSMQLTVIAKIQLPLDEGQPQGSIDFCLNYPFSEKIDEDLDYSDAIADDPISLGTMANGGAKVVLIKSPIGGCKVAFNGSPEKFPVLPRGACYSSNPLEAF